MDPIASRLNQAPKSVSASGEVRFEVDLHDRQQLEIELAYPLSHHQESTYDVEMYLFIPRNVGVGSQNYSKETFYNDLRAYLRMDSPALHLADLIDFSCQASPLYQLQEAIEALEKQIALSSPRPVVALVKLFGHSFRESVHNDYQKILNDLNVLKDLPSGKRVVLRTELVQAVTTWNQESIHALNLFRTLRRRFTPLAGTSHTNDVFEQVHEYATAYLIEKIALLSSALEEQTFLYDGSCLVAQLLKILHRYAKRLAKMRHQEGFVNPNPMQLHTAEFSTYRRGIIKRAMQQTFYLDTRTLRREHFRRNIVAMIAAGLASLWTLFVAIFLPGSINRSVSDWTSIALLVAAVVAYMLRDRIQEFSRIYLGKKIRYYDHDTAIVGDNLTLLGLRGIKGRVREKANWTTPDKLPSSIVYLRTHPRTVAGTDISTEETFYYERLLTLGTEDQATLPPGFALRDILRFNLRHFMARLDNPLEPIRYYDVHTDRFVRLDSPKVYHLNLIVRVVSSTEGELMLSRHRVVLNKETILRVEAVQPVAQDLSSFQD